MDDVPVPTSPTPPTPPDTVVVETQVVKEKNEDSDFEQEEIISIIDPDQLKEIERARNRHRRLQRKRRR